MADPFLWAALLISVSSLIFATIAFRQIMKTSSEVHEVVGMAKKFMAGFKSSAKGVFTPKFMAATIEEAVTSGLKNEDGSQVTMPQYIAGWAHAVGPGVYQDLKKEIPNYIPLILNPQSQPSPGGPPNKGTQLADARWGSGGLKAATNVAKAAKKLPFGQKVAEYVEGAQALVGLGGAIRDLKNEI